MARQSSVNAAYTKLNQKPGGCSRLFVSCGLAAFLLFFLSSGGSDGSANSDNLRSGQAHHDTNISVAVVEPPSSSAFGDSSSTTEALQDEEDLQDAVMEVENDIENAADEELEEVQAQIDTATTGVANKIRFGVGRLFGSQLTVEEAEEVANQVETTLATEAKQELRDAADNAATLEVNSMNEMVESEEEAGVDADEISQDVYSQEADAVGAIKEEIDTAATSVQSHLQARAAEIEKEILEERLSAKLGKRVKLVIMNDEVQGMDDLMQGLDNLSGVQPSQPQQQQQPPAYGAATPVYGATTSSYGVPPAYGAAATPNYGAAATPAYGAGAATQVSPVSPYGVSAVQTPPASPFGTPEAAATSPYETPAVIEPLQAEPTTTSEPAAVVAKTPPAKSRWGFGAKKKAPVSGATIPSAIDTDDETEDPLAPVADSGSDNNANEDSGDEDEE